MNLADALEKLRTMIRDAEKPKTIELAPEKLEKIRKKWVKFEIKINHIEFCVSAKKKLPGSDC